MQAAQTADAIEVCQSILDIPPRCKGILDGVEILESARKHEVADADILHAWENALRYVELEMYGEDRLLVLGPDRAGRMLELIAVPVDGPARIIHADNMRAKFHQYLR